MVCDLKKKLREETVKKFELGLQMLDDLVPIAIGFYGWYRGSNIFEETFQGGNPPKRGVMVILNYVVSAMLLHAWQLRGRTCSFYLSL